MGFLANISFWAGFRVLRTTPSLGILGFLSIIGSGLGSQHQGVLSRVSGFRANMFFQAISCQHCGNDKQHLSSGGFLNQRLLLGFGVWEATSSSGVLAAAHSMRPCAVLRGPRPLARGPPRLNVKKVSAVFEVQAGKPFASAD